MRRATVLILMLGTAGALAVLPGCGSGCPSEGDSCDREGQERASDSLVPLTCHDGKWGQGRWSGNQVCCGDLCVVA